MPCELLIRRFHITSLFPANFESAPAAITRFLESNARSRDTAMILAQSEHGLAAYDAGRLHTTLHLRAYSCTMRTRHRYMHLLVTRKKIAGVLSMRIPKNPMLPSVDSVLLGMGWSRRVRLARLSLGRLELRSRES